MFCFGFQSFAVIWCRLFGENIAKTFCFNDISKSVMNFMLTSSIDKWSRKSTYRLETASALLIRVRRQAVTVETVYRIN